MKLHLRNIKSLDMGNLKKLIFQVLYLWGLFLIYLHLRVFREVSLLDVIYFTTLEKYFFCPETR